MPVAKVKKLRASGSIPSATAAVAATFQTTLLAGLQGAGSAKVRY
ncbi:hypothetical protein MBUL_03183 [Methylobacterium bullatum]|uniref:Uncharacterized protein n=1 Tax=Methylobacterium bullatum TaxID=570505 RepID=A0A679J344_9HYPH|nr:hypothetical protein MBUL_03183 [Methylobacterium bullatum]